MAARIPAVLALTFGVGALALAEPSRQDLEDWFNAPPAPSAAEVNEGDLVFLSRHPDKPVHHHHNALTLTASSLVDGWAGLRQCHRHLDQVTRAQILFSPDRTRKLRIDSVTGIDRAWVEASTVQLENVGPSARLCVSLESRSLTREGEGIYTLRNGPFMRQFLDGFYPMHVSMEVRFADAALRFVGSTPHPQRGLKVTETAGTVHLDAWFEGKLRTELIFDRPDAL